METAAVVLMQSVHVGSMPKMDRLTSGFIVEKRWTGSNYSYIELDSEIQNHRLLKTEQTRFYPLKACSFTT